MSSVNGDAAKLVMTTTMAALRNSAARRLTSGKRRQMVMFPAKHITASRARRSPVSVGSPTELDTITAMPTMVRVMATATRRVMGSPRNSRAHSEAISGAAATMATTLATRVSVMAVMKASWLTDASAPTPMIGNRWVRSDSSAGRRSNHRPKVE